MLSRVKKLISLAALGLAVMTGALAQSIDFSSLPQCAQPPILNTIGRSKCDPTKPQCLCTDDAIVNDLVALIAKSCSGDDLTRAVAFGQALCINLATQTLVTISDSRTTFTVYLNNPAGTPMTTAAPVTTTEAPSMTETSTSKSESGANEPTTSVIAGNGTNVTSQGNRTVPEQFQGDAPEFGPTRLWSMAIAILMMAAIFAEL
ncbi:hypothetical protein MPH_02531 [Macrophomina phaseolina MS6]|uniref:CFEM domain-containing protein n=1 Tax=Macrophomina phaseolina (strain MS6) TaxID=1126212 RepID=K2SCP0_MACPH|nr:hypothetical protein MPH_02531 [Macrophomina phaseolina MS6]